MCLNESVNPDLTSDLPESWLYGEQYMELLYIQTAEDLEAKRVEVCWLDCLVHV